MSNGLDAWCPLDRIHSVQVGILYTEVRYAEQSGICVSLSHGEGRVAHPLWSLMKIDFLLCFPKTGSMVFEGCSWEQTVSILYVCLLQLMTVGCTSSVWGIPKPPLAVNKPSFSIIICRIWNFLTLVCLSCQSWISLLSRSILQSWYLFWAHHCVVCMWCCLEQEPFLYCLSLRTCRSGMNLFRELFFFYPWRDQPLIWGFPVWGDILPCADRQHQGSVAWGLFWGLH